MGLPPAARLVHRVRKPSHNAFFRFSYYQINPTAFD